jgi:hypothetical protein
VPVFFAAFCQILGFSSGKRIKIAVKISFVYTNKFTNEFIVRCFLAKWQSGKN